MPLITGAIILGGAGVLEGAMTSGAGAYGDQLSYEGQMATNAENLQIAQSQENYQTISQGQAESFDEQMSDTAEQRRVADLQAAGLNPLLAAGNPASSPTISGQSGASIAMQNPDAAFANMGQTAASAGNQVMAGLQAGINASSAQAQIGVANAQAKSIGLDAAAKAAQLPYSGATAAQTLQNLSDTNKEILAHADQMQQQAGVLGFQQDLTAEQYKQLAQTTQFQSEMQPLQLAMQKYDVQAAKLGLPGMENNASFNSSWFGRNVMPYVNGVVQPMLNATGAAIGNSHSALSLAERVVK